MFVRVKKISSDKPAHRRGNGAVAAWAAATFAFTVAMAMPVAIDFERDGFSLLAQSTALAKGGGGGNGGGGNGGGGNGGGGNGGGNGGGSTGGTGGDASSPGANAARGDIRDGGRDHQLPIFAGPSIGMATFTTTIKKRYPADNIAVLENPHQAISFFSELNSMTGKTVTHRWVYEGAVQYETSFEVMAKRWRVWSTRLLPADQPGEWTVEIVDENETVLAAHSLIFKPSPSARIAVTD